MWGVGSELANTMDKRNTPIPTVYDGVQLLRGIAAILVLLLHLTAIEKKYGWGITELPSIFGYGAAGVDIFFVISGFIMTTITRDMFRSSREIQFLRRRFIRIFPIYWLYSLLVLVVFVIKPELVNGSQGGHVNIFKSFLLLPDNNLPLLAVGWSLIYEVYFYLILSVVLKVIKSSSYPLFLISWAAFVALSSWALSRLTGSNPWLKLMSSPLSLEFIFGCFIAIYFKKIKEAYGLPIFLLGAGALLETFFYLDVKSIHIYDSWNTTLVFGSSASLLVLGAVVSESTLKTVLPKIILSVGDSSYSLYLSHVLVISALGRLWFYLPIGHKGIGHLVSLAVIFAIAVGWSLLSYKFIEIPIIDWFSRKKAIYVS
jgi:exopolysaccharide production protein ExoZ